MQTEVMMKREMFGMEIKQKSKTEFFSATDLVKAGNKWRTMNGLSLFDLTEWLRRKSSIEFIETLSSRYGKVKISARGRGHDTWVHPYLFIDIALAISPDLKIEVYEWLFDHLLRYRNDSGDSYLKMAGALWERCRNKSSFKEYIASVANKIKLACHVTDWNKAQEHQLKMRYKIQENIALLSEILPNLDEAVRLGIIKSFNKKELN